MMKTKNQKKKKKLLTSSIQTQPYASKAVRIYEDPVPPGLAGLDFIVATQEEAPRPNDTGPTPVLLFHPPEHGACTLSVRDFLWLTLTPELHPGISQPKASWHRPNHAEEHTNTLTVERVVFQSSGMFLGSV